ncbi:fibronectin type III domain-containing protein, partial [bacterium]|nr:fibronectin type III domain-containing protein [bacterium]
YTNWEDALGDRNGINIYPSFFVGDVTSYTLNVGSGQVGRVIRSAVMAIDNAGNESNWSPLSDGIEIKGADDTLPAENSLVRTSDTVKVYLFKGGRKWWIVNEDIFNRLGYDWSNIIDYSPGILDQYPDGPNIVSDGSLIRREGTNEVYFIENGQRRWITTAEAFNQMGLSWEDIYDVPSDGWDNFITLFPLGSEITWDTIPPTVTMVCPTGGENWLAGGQQTIMWIATDDIGIDHIDIIYTTDGWLSSGEIASNLPNTGSHSWNAPAVNTNNAAIRVAAYDKAGNAGYDYSANFTISSDISEAPYAPTLCALGSSTVTNQVALRWRKVIDSDHNDNVTYYEVEYADNSSFNNAVNINIGNPATGANIYETISYTITGLEDDKTYYFRVRATNNVGTSGWSNYESILVDIQDFPYFDESYQEPANGATNVSKTPILRWRAYDVDGDNLDYYVAYGTDPNNVDYPLRGFKSDHEGQNWFDFSQEYHEPLKPNTTYYWQIWVREDGYYSDYYGGEYIKSPVWHFTTVATGSDLAITSVAHEGEMRPDSTVIFKVTVKNLGSETAISRSIKCSYIKNGSESPFWTGWGYMSGDLPPGQEEVVDVTVQFRDRVWESNGVVYDNVLVSGESQIRFYFAYDDGQDVNSTNNEMLYTINYVDAGGPVITYFDIREYGSMYEDWGTSFWARMGQELRIIIEAHDDIKVARGIIELNYDNTTENWVLLYDGTNDYDNMQFYSDYCIGCSQCGSNFVDWPIPTGIQTTDNAQVRVRLYDDKNNETIKISEIFSIYSNRIDVTIEPNLSAYTVGEDLTFAIVNDSDNDIRSIEVRLLYGSGSQTIYSEQNDNGIVAADQYQWNIPDANYYSSQNCYLELEITDIRGNTKTVRSSRFKIDANTELPSPFNSAIILYDDEFDFPAEALSTDQYQSIKFVKIDESNIVHAVVGHMYRYYLDTGTGDEEDTLIYVNNKFYITYDKSSDTISSKIKVCDKNYEVADFEIFDGTPYALVKCSDGREQYYYTYKSGSSFVEPIIIENENIPTIGNTTKVDDLQDFQCTFSDPTKSILLNGYLWNLDIFTDEISRRSFSGGYIGDNESITIQNNAGDVESFWIEPTSDGDVIYFIHPRDSKLVKFDTGSLIATSYQLPFTVGTERSDATKTSLAALGGTVFIFGNGKVYALEGENIIEKAHIAYTFDGETVDHADRWNLIRYSKAVKTENKIYLIFDDWSYQAKPTWTTYEILEFDIQSCTFSKSIARTRLNSLINRATYVEAGGYPSSNNYSFDVEYIGGNKALVAFADETTYSSSLRNYFSYLNMLDLETGDIVHIGRLPFKAKNNYVSLIYSGGDVYAIGQNSENGHSESYSLVLDNLENRPNQVSQIQFLEHNDQLHAAWAKGNPYNGTWNYQENRINDYTLSKNKFLQIYPALGSITDFSDEDLGYSLNIVGDYLSSSYGKVYSLNPDLTVNQMLYDMDWSSPLEYKSFGSTFIASFSQSTSGKMDFTLLKDDLSAVTFDSLTQSNEIATYDDELILVGYGYEPYQSKNVVTKLDLTTGERSIIAFGSADSFDNYKKVDINGNKYVAVAWSNYLAVADLSGDIVQPEMSFSNSGGQITDGSTVMLSWQANDNQDELVKYEIYKIVEGASTLLDTMTDVSITSFDYVVSEGSAGEITFKIIAYDYDGNASYDTVTYSIITPVQFNSFAVNKSTVQLGEKLIFTWSANGSNTITAYNVYKKRAGGSEWEAYFQVTGETSKEIYVEGFVGEHHFKIEADNDSMELSHTVNIEGEILNFDYTGFSPKVKAYYIAEPVIDFVWGLQANMSETVYYELYTKSEGENGFSRIARTSDTSFRFISQETSAFDWKVVADYQGVTYESDEFHVQLEEIISPNVTSLVLKNNNTDSPAVEIQFSPITGINEYVVVRRSSSGVYGEIAVVTENTYTDNTVIYGEYYEYAISSKIGDLIGKVGGSQEILIELKGIKDITILNENYTFLDANEISVNIVPDSDGCYENYEVMIGTSLDSMNLFAVTQERTILISNLDYATTYYINIYPLDHKDDRLTNLPVTLAFTILPPPIPDAPNGLTASLSSQINLSWNDNSTNENGFKIERKTGLDGTYRQIGIVEAETASFEDAGIQSDKIYYYRVRAYNISGNSVYSNEVAFQTIRVEGGVTLYPGWNLISLPVTPDDTSTETVLA